METNSTSSAPGKSMRMVSTSMNSSGRNNNNNNSSNNNSNVSADNSPAASLHASTTTATAAEDSKMASTTYTAATSTGTSTSTGRSKNDAEDDAGVIAAPADTLNTSSFQSNGDGGPAEIPPEPSAQDRNSSLHGMDDDDDDNVDGGMEVDREEQGGEGEDDDDDDESEYEYEDDEDAAFSGFLVDHPPLATTNNSSSANQSTEAQGGTAGSAAAPARIEEESITNNSSSNNNHNNHDEAATTSTLAVAATDAAAAKAAAEPKKKWREPSRAAVSMSIRAETEKTGSKRRLAQDLYRIMNQDTEEAGFSIAPKSEDNMDHWIIKLFMFDPDSNLAKDMVVLGFEHVELEMTFPDQYPFEPPFVRVVRPRFKRQTGFVMNGALCMELLTKDGWNPVNDIESVIVSIRSLLVVGDGRLQAAHEMSESKYQARLKANRKPTEDQSRKRQKKDDETEGQAAQAPEDGGSYSVAEAHAAYSHLSDYHKKKGWDSSGWWARKG